jgi:hypothetical protein
MWDDMLHIELFTNAHKINVAKYIARLPNILKCT